MSSPHSPHLPGHRSSSPSRSRSRSRCYHDDCTCRHHRNRRRHRHSSSISLSPSRSRSRSRSRALNRRSSSRHSHQTRHGNRRPRSPRRHRHSHSRAPHSGCQSTQRGRGTATSSTPSLHCIGESDGDAEFELPSQRPLGNPVSHIGNANVSNKRRRVGIESSIDDTVDVGTAQPGTIMEAQDSSATAEQIKLDIELLEQRMREREEEINAAATPWKEEKNKLNTMIEECEKRIKAIEFCISSNTNQKTELNHLQEEKASLNKRLETHFTQMGPINIFLTENDKILAQERQKFQWDRNFLYSKLNNLPLTGIVHHVQCTPVPEKNLQVVKQYREIGQQLKGADPSLNSLEAAVQQCWECSINTEQCPFVLVCGSAGVGKTQLAFGLSRKTIYVPLVPTDIEDRAERQRVVRPFIPFTESLLKCVKKDMEEIAHMYGGAKLGISTAALSNKSLWINAWVQWVLSHRDMDWPWCAFQEPFSVALSKKCVADDVRKMALSFSESECPCFFLDEANIKDKEHLFIRNALLMCGVCLILCGTDVNIANFAGSLQISGSSCPIESRQWCILVHKKSPSICPMVVSDVTPVLDHISLADKAVSDFLECLIRTARPRFAIAISQWILEMDNKAALLKGSLDKSSNCITTSTTSSSASRQNSSCLQNLVDNIPELLNILSNKLFKWVLNSKPTIRGTSYGKAGQVCLFCADCYFLPENCPHAPSSSEHDDRNNKSGRRQTSEKKKPTAVSQKQNETTSQKSKQQFVAMHFAHLDLEEGTQKFAPFFNKFGNATTARLAFYDTCGCTAISNASAPGSSANYLEQLAGVAACAASRSIGFSKQGLNSTEFLGFFLRHLLQEPKTKDGNWNPTQPLEKIGVQPRLEQFCQLLAPPPSPSTTTGSDPSCCVGTPALGDDASAAANFLFPGVGFMPPPNCEWPTVLRALVGLKLSTLKSVPNAEHTDIKIDGGIITIECKNKKVGTRHIRDILKRIDKHTRLTLAVCKHLQDRFFRCTKKKPAAPTTTPGTRNTSKSLHYSQTLHSHSAHHSRHNHPSRRSRSRSRSRSSSYGSRSISTSHSRSRSGSHSRSSRSRSSCSRSSRSLSPQGETRAPLHGTPPVAAPLAAETGNTAIVRVFVDEATGTAVLRPIPNFPNPETSSTEHLLVLIETGDVETNPYSETHNPRSPTTSKTSSHWAKH